MVTDSTPAHEEGLLASLQRLGRSLIGVLVTRLEILSTEVAEERSNLARLSVVALLVLFCLQLGLGFALLFVVLAVSPEHRLAAVGIVALLLLLGALAGGLWLRAWLRSRPRMFATTIAELNKDADRLRGQG